MPRAQKENVGNFVFFAYIYFFDWCPKSVENGVKHPEMQNKAKQKKFWGEKKWLPLTNSYVTTMCDFCGRTISK